MALLFGCLLAGCSSGSSNPASPTGPDRSIGAGADDASGPDTAADDAGTADAGPDVFASCPTSRPTTGSFPADVAQVLVAKCQTCHQMPPKNHAPFPILTYAQSQTSDPLSPFTGVPIWQVMHKVIQPKGVPHMPFGNAPQLTAAEMSTLDGWLLGCALPDGASEGGDAPSGDEAGAEPADGSSDSSADAGGGSNDAGGQ